MNVNNRIAAEALALNPGTVDAVALQVERFGSDLKMERSNFLRARLRHSGPWRECELL